jgi:hypothetical protein
MVRRGETGLRRGITGSGREKTPGGDADDTSTTAPLPDGWPVGRQVPEIPRICEKSRALTT